MRPSTLFLAQTALLTGLVAAAALHGRVQAREAARQRADSRALVRALGLTDLCLATEARYTRHPSQADRHAPFQDHPGAQDHFPSGALVAPPAFPSPHERPPAAPRHP